MSGVSMIPVSPSQRDSFLRMAVAHFSELNPSFVPHSDWRQHYFETIHKDSRYSLRWILSEEQCAGFILFGIENHRFLPRKTGVIYELYVVPAFRRQGVARRCAQQVMKELWSLGLSKIQLEVVEGNTGAAAFWRSLDFRRMSEHYELTTGAP